ncbi:MAG: hypothetical protein H6657_14975 [Ardenticatenaceae bacterium]|nr:hypothetical protein [Ardenticatenaceae bacterium]
MDQQDWDKLYELLDELSRDEIDLNVRRQFVLHVLIQMYEHLQSKNELIARIIELRRDNQLAIASQLHDGPLQELSAATQLFQQEIQDPSTDFKKTNALDFVVRVQESIQDIRHILLDSANLQSQDNFDLVSQLREAIRVGRVDGSDISLLVEDDLEFLKEIPPRMRKVILLFVQETIRNARNHGNADQLKIIVKKQNNYLVLMTIDNGSGFSFLIPEIRGFLQYLADQGHLGLRVIAELASPFEGRVNIIPSNSELGGAQVDLLLKLS